MDNPHTFIWNPNEKIFYCTKENFNSGMGKKGRVKSNPHSKIDPIMPGH